MSSRTNLEQRKYNVKQCWEGANKTFLNESGYYYNHTYGIFDRDFFKHTIANVSDDCFNLTKNYLVDEEDADKEVNMEYKLSVYAGLVLTVFLLSLVRTTSFFQMCMRASITLHNKMFRCVLRSPVAFFDNNPVGKSIMLQF